MPQVALKETKPMTAEAVIAAQPDVYVLFTTSLKSVGGVDGLLKLPGLAHTPAGQNRRVVTLDGQYLSGFGPPLWARMHSTCSEASTKLTDISLQQENSHFRVLIIPYG